MQHNKNIQFQRVSATLLWRAFQIIYSSRWLLTFRFFFFLFFGIIQISHFKLFDSWKIKMVKIWILRFGCSYTRKLWRGYLKRWSELNTNYWMVWTVCGNTCVLFSRRSFLIGICLLGKQWGNNGGIAWMVACLPT